MWSRFLNVLESCQPHLHRVIMCTLAHRRRQLTCFPLESQLFQSQVAFEIVQITELASTELANANHTTPVSIVPPFPTATLSASTVDALVPTALGHASANWVGEAMLARSNNLDAETIAQTMVPAKMGYARVKVAMTALIARLRRNLLVA